MATVLGNKIYKERKKLGLTLEQLAEKIDSRKSYVWELEKKDDINPTADKLAKLAKALNVSVDYLINDDLDEASDLDNAKVLWRRVDRLTPEKKAAFQAVLDSLEDD